MRIRSKVDIEKIEWAFGNIETWSRVAEKAKRRATEDLKAIEERSLELEKAIEGQLDGSTWELTQTKPDEELIEDMRAVLKENERQTAFFKGICVGMAEYERITMGYLFLDDIRVLFTGSVGKIEEREV